MRNLAHKLSAVAICTVFASMQIAAAADGIGNSNIINTTGGFVGDTTTGSTRTLEFNGNSHVTWGQLNVGAGETLNFNAVDGASGLTILNTVTSGMTKIYGQVNSNSGIAKLIISNPNGMLYDGASFTTAGDLMLTTQALGSQFTGTDMTVVGLDQTATQGITIQNSDFTVGGEFNIVAPDINAIASTLSGSSVKLVTRDGQNYLVSAVNNDVTKGVRLEAVSINGDVSIISGRDNVRIVNGGTVNGDLNIDSQGIIGLNYNPGNQLHVTGDLNAKTNGTMAPAGENGVKIGNLFYVRNTQVDGDMNLRSDSGFIEVKNVNVGNDMNLTTTNDVATPRYKHFVHVNGDNTVGGNVNINSADNIHIGNYDKNLQDFLPGSLNVGGDLTAVSHNGSIAVTVPTQAQNIDLKAGLNILTDGTGSLKANTYKLDAGYVGSLTEDTDTIDVMERYIPLAQNANYADKQAYAKIKGGDITKLNANIARIESTGDLTVNGVTANEVTLSAVSETDPLGADITINDDVHANMITVDGATKNLKVNNAAGARDYTFKFTDILDTEVVTVNPDVEITWDMTDGSAPGWNNNTQTAANTRIVGPARPVDPTPPGPEPTPDVPATLIGNGMERDEIATAIDAGEVFIPIGYAADLDEEKDTGVRKNVDGSVTVVKPFIPSNK